VSRDTDDKILSITGYVQDVTEKTFSAINLEDAYRELSLLFKHIDEVFFSRDVVSNRLTQISPTCERLFGYTPDEFEQNPGLWAKIIHPEDRKTAEQQNKLLANGLPLFNQYRIIRKDKAIRFVENKIIPTLDAAGRLIRIDGFTLDITEKTQSARERERIIADLIQRNNTLEEFTYIVSHNLRVPIANILGLGIVLKDIDTDPNERQATIDFILSSVRSLDLIVHDLNTVLQVREEVRGKKEPVFFNELVFDVENSLNLVLAGKDIHIHCDFEQISNIFSLRNYLYSIFYNLILNSINYRREGIETRISIRSDLSNSDVILTFTDNGKGIDLEKNGDTLFGLYRRYDTSVEGKGMGLFMVKTQVLALGGTVDVKSKPGKGTTFVITLPLHSQ
jgi:PAS domain S-box-containing protein